MQNNKENIFVSHGVIFVVNISFKKFKCLRQDSDDRTTTTGVDYRLP